MLKTKVKKPIPAKYYREKGTVTLLGETQRVEGARLSRNVPAHCAWCAIEPKVLYRYRRGTKWSRLFCDKICCARFYENYTEALPHGVTKKFK